MSRAAVALSIVLALLLIGAGWWYWDRIVGSEDKSGVLQDLEEVTAGIESTVSGLTEQGSEMLEQIAQQTSPSGAIPTSPPPVFELNPSNQESTATVSSDPATESGTTGTEADEPEITEEQQLFLQQLTETIQEQEAEAQAALQEIAVQRQAQAEVEPEPEAAEQGAAKKQNDIAETDGSGEEKIAESENEEEGTEQDTQDLPALQYQPYVGARSYYFDDLTGVGGRDFEVDETRLYAGVSFNKPIFEDWVLDGNIRASYQFRHLYTDGLQEQGGFVDVKRLRLLGEYIFGSPHWSLELGRKRISSRHGWMFDDDMDAIELSYDSTLLDMKFGYATWLWDGLLGAGLESLDTDQKLESSGSTFYFANGQYQWHKDHYLQLDVLLENFDNPRPIPNGNISNNNALTRDSKLLWLKASAYGLNASEDNEYEYWLDAALVNGNKNVLQLSNGRVQLPTEQDVNMGLAIQFGVVARFDNKRFGLGVTAAFADAAVPRADQDDSYVQPVVASNRKTLFGKRKRRYYGELLAPQLENLKVFGLHAGYAWEPDLWWELSFNQYWQDRASRNQFQSRLAFIPNGINTHIGRSLELMLGGQLSPDTEIEFIATVFWAGDAFHLVADETTAYRIQLLLQTRW